MRVLYHIINILIHTLVLASSHFIAKPLYQFKSIFGIIFSCSFVTTKPPHVQRCCSKTGVFHPFYGCDESSIQCDTITKPQNGLEHIFQQSNHLVTITNRLFYLNILVDWLLHTNFGNLISMENTTIVLWWKNDSN